MKLYYMRDTHTFRALPLDVERAIIVLREEFADGCTHGMLCTKSISVEPVRAHGQWAEFEHKARLWLAGCVNYKSPGDLEYESWAAPAGVPGCPESGKHCNVIGGECQTCGNAGVRVMSEAQLRERVKALQADAMAAGFVLLASYSRPDGSTDGVDSPDGEQQ